MISIKLVIYGAGRLGAEIYEVAERANEKSEKWSEILFVDQEEKDSPIENVRLIVLDKFFTEENIEDYLFVIAIGEPSIREKVYNRLRIHDIRFGNVIDPKAVISKRLELGEGTVIIGHTSVNIGCVIGKNVLIQSNCSIGHDIHIGNHTVISAGFLPGGGTRIGASTYIGLGTIAKENSIVGNNSIIGMGSVISREIGDEVIAMGNPCRAMKKNESEMVFKTKVEKED